MNYIEPAHHSTLSMRQISEQVRGGSYQIPPFQRSFVWENKHILHLLDSILQGFHIGNALVWERHNLPEEQIEIAGIASTGQKHRYLIIDGQQRIGALARAFTTDQFAWDFSSKRFVIDQPVSDTVLPLCFLGRSYMDGLHQWFNDGGSTDNAGWLMDNLMHSRYMSFMILPASWELPKVMEMFRRLNRAGIRMTSKEVESALRRVAA